MRGWGVRGGDCGRGSGFGERLGSTFWVFKERIGLFGGCRWTSAVVGLMFCGEKLQSRGAALSIST